METCFHKLVRSPRPNCVFSSAGTGWGGWLTEKWTHDEPQWLPRFSSSKPLLGLYTKGDLTCRWRASGVAHARAISAGTVFFMDAGHELEDVRTDGPEACLLIELDTAKHARWTGNDGGPSRSTSLRPHFIVEDNAIAFLMLAIENELTNGCASGRLFDESISLALISYIEGRFSASGSAHAIQSQGLSRVKLRRLHDFIAANLSLEIGLNDLARLVDLNPQHLCRSFKKATGTSPYRYILEARIEKAKNILAGDSLTVAETALAVGFSSQSHFSDTFRKLTGMSPSQWQRK